jgi:glycosyltransferase involved in cell wall biosynthesis
VVATAVGAIPQVIVSNKTGVLVPSENHQALSEAILFLINNKPISLQLGGALHIFVTTYFSKAAYMEELIKIYQRV